MQNLMATYAPFHEQLGTEYITVFRNDLIGVNVLHKAIAVIFLYINKTFVSMLAGKLRTPNAYDFQPNKNLILNFVELVELFPSSEC